MNKPTKGSKLRGKATVYEDAFKIAVAREYLKGELGYLRLGTKHKLPTTTVRDFVAWYKSTFDQCAPTAATTQPATPPLLKKDPDPKVAELQKQLDDALLKIAGLQTMIAIADKEFGTSILKKPGAKQSRP